MFVSFPEVISVELASVVLQAVDGTQTEIQIDGENLGPALVTPSLCANVVLKVSQPDAATRGIHADGH